MIKKRNFIFMTMALLLLLTSFILNPQHSQANDKPLYGFTKSGTFFLHKDVFTATQLWGSPQIMGGFNGWNPSPMTVENNYYTYRASTTGEFYEKQCYCFKIDDNNYIPHVLINKGSKLISRGDYEGNGQKGYNFCTTPYNSLPFK